MANARRHNRTVCDLFPADEGQYVRWACMMGGKAAPADDEEERAFKEKCIEAFKHDNKLCFSERWAKDNKGRLAFDLDMVIGKGEFAEYIEKVAECIFEAMAGIYDPLERGTLSAVVSYSQEPKGEKTVLLFFLPERNLLHKFVKAEDVKNVPLIGEAVAVGGVKYYKFDVPQGTTFTALDIGCHIRFSLGGKPLIVSVEESNAMHAVVVNHLNWCIPAFDEYHISKADNQDITGILGHPDWKEKVDNCTLSGLKPPGMYKTRNCPASCRKSAAYCYLCHGGGVVVGSKHDMIMFFDGEGKRSPNMEDTLQRDLSLLWDMTTLYSSSENPAEKRDDFFPPICGVDYPYTDLTSAQHYKERSADETDYTPTSAVFQSILRLIRRHWKDRSDGELKQITSVKKITDTDGDFYYLVSTNSKNCDNVETEHTSNHIYFIVRLDGIRQKCHNSSSSLVGRLHGKTCAEWNKVSKKYPLLAQTQQFLFDRTLPEGMKPMPPPLLSAFTPEQALFYRRDQLQKRPFQNHMRCKKKSKKVKRK